MITEELLGQIVHDLKMRSEVCCTLSSMVGRNLDAMKKREALSHPTVVEELNFDQLHHQVYQIMVTIRELEGEIEDAS
ncbi:hypothetical protein [Rhizobium sp. SAFR-030]|uniref:hypothetical protein n=1 Tax=Rhizobium sp. SAFR-030 TaxID=3387277 RepID=UPI003F7EECDE